MAYGPSGKEHRCHQLAGSTRSAPAHHRFMPWLPLAKTKSGSPAIFFNDCNFFSIYSFKGDIENA